MTVRDRQYMAEAIQLARKGLYTTDPNPRVGCVLVKDDEIVGRGYHEKAGEGHAEVNALREAGEKARGATAYVTLEPCSHFGKTPPCAIALVEAGIARVVSGMQDPNPQVSGRGMAILQEAGVEVVSGVLENEARELNPGFIKRMETGMPFVRVKMAMSLDGRTAMQSGESQWITGASARSDVQRFRARSSAIITGSGSIIHDDSSLMIRENELQIENASRVVERQPLRVVLDSRGQLESSARIFNQPGQTLWITQANKAAPGAKIVSEVCDRDSVNLKALLRYLSEKEQCNEVLVETGARLAGGFVKQELVDELVVYMAPTLLGSSARPLLDLPLDLMAQQQRLVLKDQRFFGDDLRLVYTFQKKVG